MLWAAQKVSSQPTETASQVAGGVLVFARDEPAGSDGQPGGWLVPEKEILKFLRKQGSGILDWFKHEEPSEKAFYTKVNHFIIQDVKTKLILGEYSFGYNSLSVCETIGLTTQDSSKMMNENDQKQFDIATIAVICAISSTHFNQIWLRFVTIVRQQVGLKLDSLGIMWAVNVLGRENFKVGPSSANSLGYSVLTASGFGYYIDKECRGSQNGSHLTGLAKTTDEEIDEQELEAHYSYMAKIQEVPNADSGTDLSH
ncbi:hypothetical protein Tco_1439598 [Tanacetum coccineum]